MEGPEQIASAELPCNLPFLASLPEIQVDADESETLVMTLFEQYRNPLLRYAVSFGVPVADAEEIVQEVFLSLFRHLRRGRSRQNLRGWIFRVAHNLTLRRRHENKRLLDAIDHDPGIAAVQIDPSPSPEECYADRQRQRRMLAVVQSLPDTAQSCIRMRAEGLHYREIAKALGISLGSVSISLTRAFAKLICVNRG